MDRLFYLHLEFFLSTKNMSKKSIYLFDNMPKTLDKKITLIYGYFKQYFFYFCILNFPSTAIRKYLNVLPNFKDLHAPLVLSKTKINIFMPHRK